MKVCSVPLSWCVHRVPCVLKKAFCAGNSFAGATRLGAWCAEPCVPTLAAAPSQTRDDIQSMCGSHYMDGCQDCTGTGFSNCPKPLETLSRLCLGEPAVCPNLAEALNSRTKEQNYLMRCLICSGLQYICHFASPAYSGLCFRLQLSDAEMCLAMSHACWALSNGITPHGTL